MSGSAIKYIQTLPLYHLPEGSKTIRFSDVLKGPQATTILRKLLDPEGCISFSSFAAPSAAASPGLLFAPRPENGGEPFITARSPENGGVATGGRKCHIGQRRYLGTWT